MKIFARILVGCFLALGALEATAGSGHYHGPVSQEQAEATAENIVNNMVKQKSLSQSWEGRPVRSLERVKLGGDLVWRAMFSNDQVKVPSEQTLNVFLTLTGGFIRANYTSK